jgi:hypothetical protein
MSPQIRARERTNDDQPTPFGTSNGECRLDQPIADMT